MCGGGGDSGVVVVVVARVRERSLIFLLFSGNVNSPRFLLRDKNACRQGDGGDGETARTARRRPRGGRDGDQCLFDGADNRTAIVGKRCQSVAFQEH